MTTPTTAHAERTRETRRIADRRLRWICPPAELGIESTTEVQPIAGIVGQDDAVEALQFGLEIDAPGQNVYVRGLTGTGRSTLVRRLLEGAPHPCRPAPDYCYVHNFDNPDRPSLITLPRGRGRAFRDRVDELVTYVREQLIPALSSDEMKSRRAELDRELQEEAKAITEPFEAELASAGLGIVMVSTPAGAQPAIVPVIDGEPATPDRFQALVAEGKLSEERVAELQDQLEKYRARMDEVGEKLGAAREVHGGRVRELLEREARTLLDYSVNEIRVAFPGEAVERFLSGMIDDVIARRLGPATDVQDEARRYRVNLLLSHEPGDLCPILEENQPSLRNLVGTIDRQVVPGGAAYSDHLMIHPGALLRADGGYLVLEAREVLSEPGAWRVLVRTLRTGQLGISPQESLLFGSNAALEPESIPVRLKVILIGEPGLYQALDAYDSDFPNLFKVLADFDSSVPRDAEALRHYAGVLARIVTEENLPHFGADAVAALAEHGARISGRSDRLTTRFGRLADLAREAAFRTTKDGRDRVVATDVAAAIQRSRRRADLPARRFGELIADGTIQVQTRGGTVGQVNGLAVSQVGPLTYGFPARITATIGPGHAGAINIEREAQLSGAIHTKGFYILGGLLRHLMRGARHPLAFSASIAFEQSYGGIDGDSASGAEMCCLLSALTGVPLRQGIAMTGAIDQLGHVQAIGAVSEKIEGFFDVCKSQGITGDQGVIIPVANTRDLMLRVDVVDACSRGEFHVWEVETIAEALEIFTGVDAGEAGSDGRYPDGTLLQLAVQCAAEFWETARAGAAPPRSQ